MAKVTSRHVNGKKMLNRLDRKDIPSAGAGESPIVGLAPAVGNAIFQAINVRYRSLPLAPKGLTQAS